MYCTVLFFRYAALLLSLFSAYVYRVGQKDLHRSPGSPTRKRRIFFSPNLTCVSFSKDHFSSFLLVQKISRGPFIIPYRERKCFIHLVNSPYSLDCSVQELTPRASDRRLPNSPLAPPAALLMGNRSSGLTFQFMLASSASNL